MGGSNIQDYKSADLKGESQVQQFQSEKKKKKKKDYLQIWPVNPSFKDINNKNSMIKTFSLFFLTFAIVFCAYLVNHDLMISIGIGIIFVFIFICAFHKELFMLRNFVSFTFKSKFSFDPFEHLIFWFRDQERSTLFISNRDDLTNLAIRIFKVEVIPENVHPTISQFLRTLSSKNIRIPFTYQVIQKPIINLNNEGKNQVSKINTLDSICTTILFTIFYNTNGILTGSKVERLEYYIRQFSNNLKSALVDNFHHFKVSLLEDGALLNSIRTYYIKDNSNLDYHSNEKELLNRDGNQVLFRSCVCITAIILFDYFLFSLKLMVLAIIGINLIIIILITVTWWREIFFLFTKNKLKKEDTIKIVNPFKGVDFYYINKLPDTLFLHIDNRILLGLKILNLKYIYNSPFCLLGRFFEAVNNHKIFLSYTLENQPISYYEFYNKGFNHVHEKVRRNMLRGVDTAIKSEVEGEKWLGLRYGMWYSILNITVSTYKIMRTIELEDFYHLEEDLEVKMETLRGAFNMNFQSYEVINLKSRCLISGFLFSTIKNHFFRINGTHLNYIMLQGTTLALLTSIADILKKGVETKIGAEFNSPMHIENYITIGNTINLEVLEKEVPVGFTKDQLKNLLITNGTSLNREITTMKIVSELVKVGVPSLVFDFNGKWSKLLTFFKRSRYEKELLYFKLGSAFTIDPLVSDIPYDQDNTRYLEYMYDAYSLAFKKDERSIEVFRNTIMRNPDMDLPSIQLELQTQNDWEKSPFNESLISLFSDFSQQDLTFFQGLHGENKEKIHSYDFVKYEKTIIVDLSILRDLNKKLFFAFLILSKIIHYINNSEEYQEKIIILPNSDIFFDSFYIDKKMNYGKINMFLDPLIHHGFGFILCANQIRYLHNNVFNYFNNIISFKAIESRDVATLSSLMNLQELEGRGYYSRSRNQTYQVRYLKNMKNNEILIRRDDIYQTFPATIDWEHLKKVEQATHEEIVTHMENQGFDLEKTEKQILAQAKKNIFQKDLGRYVIYIKEIIKFLDGLKSIDQIGNLYIQKVKKYLLEIIYPVALKKTTNKENIKKIRDTLFDILVKQGYLVENHPKRASGSETLRTSYSVGKQYQIALDDYFKTKEYSHSNIDYEILEKNSNHEGEIFQEQTRKYIIKQEDLKKALAREFSDFNYDLFNIYRYINYKDFKKAIKIEHDLIKKFLINIYKHFYNVNYVITSNDLRDFYSILGNIEEFPFTVEELVYHVERYNILDLGSDSNETLALEFYKFIYEFFIKIQHYIYEE